jgi:uncharacterized protein YjiS (DUF1127 family)
MRFEQEPLGDIMVAYTREMRRREERPGIRYIGQSRLIHIEPRTRWWGAIATVMSVVKAQAIEGFASCAIAMHPELFYQAGEPINRLDSPEVLPPVQRAGDRRWSTVPHSREGTSGVGYGAAMRTPVAQLRERQPVNGLLNLESFGRLEPARTASPGGQTWIMSIPAKLWSRLLRAGQIRRARAALEVLDDRMLNDIGVSRHEIEQVVRHGRRRS